MHCPPPQVRKLQAIKVTEPTLSGATDKIYGVCIKADLDPKRISLTLTHATGSQVYLLQLTKTHGVQNSTHTSCDRRQLLKGHFLSAIYPASVLPGVE